MTGVLVHEWLARTGGSENVFEVLIDMFPDAERWALWNDSDGRFQEIHETILARTPLRGRKALALPFMPPTWRHLPRRDADWLLVSSHLFAHQARFSGPARHAPKFVYAHTPARYIWVPELDGRGASLPARTVSSLLKPLDKRRAAEIHSVAANSAYVAERIANTWELESVVIHPPVDVETFALAPKLTDAESRTVERLPEDFLLGVSRFVPYKRLDLVIEAGRLTGLPVVLAGSGPDEHKLRLLAEERHPGRVTFVDRPSFGLLRALYRAASAVVFPPVEDFGIIPVESLASGTPVVANAVGGAAESVQQGVNGQLVQEWGGQALSDAVLRAVELNRATVAESARRFDTARFRREVVNWMQDGGAAVADREVEA